MSNFIAIATKYRGCCKIIKIETIRNFSIAANVYASKFDYRRANCNEPNKNLSIKYFDVSSRSNSTIRANVDGNNVLKSPFKDLGKFSNIFVHELVWRNFEKWSDKTALECCATGKCYTYAQMRRLCGKLATSLRKNNLLRPGDTIAAILPNVPEYAILILATSEAGLRLTLLNPLYTAEEIGNQLKMSDAKAVVTTAPKFPTVAAALTDNENVKLPIIIVDDGSGILPQGTIKFGDLMNDDIEEFSKIGGKPDVDPEDIFALPYSSGTSGLPKGVELSHRNVVANIMQATADGVTVGEEATTTHQEILPLILPIFHSYGLVVCLGSYLCFGGKMVCVPQFSPEILFKVLSEHRATLFYVAPPLIQLMANDRRLKTSHVETIKTIVTGAAPIGDEVLTKFKNLVPPNLKIAQGYGLTECSPVVSMGRDNPLSSSGHIVPNTEIRIVGCDDARTGQNLGFNEVGEIYVKGPQVMRRYYKNPQATADCMEGDWFKTGDLGCYDEAGLLYIRGRLKELIKVQGYQVAPAELEDIIQGHEKVADAAVIGVLDERYGESPKAFVVPKPGVRLEPDEIKNWVAERVAKYKRLGHVEFIASIPKSAAGKILRRELQKL